MMFRWRSRALALTLIACIVLGTTGSGHAADFRLPMPGHHHWGNNSQVCPPTDRASNEQCAICHWLQSLRFDPAAAVFVHFGDFAGQYATPLAEAPPRPPLTSTLPARAPPA
jgi:hypothetical protein